MKLWGSGRALRGASFLVFAFCLQGVAWAANEPAPDRMVVGGGYDPASSAVALERNVLDYLELEGQGAFSAVRGGKSEVFFGGGTDARQLDVAETSPAFSEDDGLFSLVLQGKDVDAALLLRHNAIAGLVGSATVTAVTGALKEQAVRLAREPGSRGRLYYTGHGGPGGTDADPYKRNVLLLRDGSLDVPSFRLALEGVPPDSRYLMVMTQCYSGGFANVLWSGGEERKGALRTNVCGFFSQRADRPAAGCSPDLARRDEYSVSFFEALRGKTLSGKSVAADFDGDGRVSAREAHGHAIATLASFDVPLATSDRYLAVEAAKGRNWKVPRKWTWERWGETFNAWDKAVAGALYQEVGRVPARAPFLPWLQERIRADRANAEAADAAADNKVKALDALAWSLAQELGRTNEFFVSQISARNGAGLVPSALSVANARKALFAHTRIEELRTLQREASAAGENALAKFHALARLERLEALLSTKALERAVTDAHAGVFLPARRAHLLSDFAALRACESEAW